jgi:ribonuclease P protein component
MIPFTYRFHGHSSLRFVYKNGQVVRSRLATLKSVGNPHRASPRFAVVVSKKVMKSAVRRNKIRRRIYEYIRLNMDRLMAPQDIVIIVTSSEFLTMAPQDVQAQLEQLFESANLYKTPHN